jgi:hypothetical protein
VVWIVASEFEALQAEVEVRFCVEPSLYVPVAVKETEFPIVTDGFGGVTAMDWSVTVPPVTIKDAEPAILENVAPIITLPEETPVANPGLAWPVVSTVASDEFDVDHEAVAVRSLVEPSL